MSNTPSPIARSGTPDTRSPNSAGGDGVFVSKVTLADFRSYASLSLTVEEPRPFVVLVGPNGAGKTNILEAISLMAPGRGLRRASQDEMARKGASGPWSAALRMQVCGNQVSVGTGSDPSGKARRLVRLNGETLSSSEALGHHWGMVWLTPQMDRIFIESPGTRRRFLDRLVFGLYPAHASHISAYEKALRERNRLLSSPGRPDAAWLTALERQMASSAAAIAAGRADYAGQLAGQLMHTEDTLPALDMALVGEGEQSILAGLKPLEVEDDYLRLWFNARAQDQKSGHTRTGPHRTDFLVRHRGKDMPADQCSTGEQKALLLALILANARLVHAARNQAPLLLMDEVAAHLDSTRRQQLFSALEALGSQVWLTGTDPASFSQLSEKSHLFTIENNTAVLTR